MLKPIWVDSPILLWLVEYFLFLGSVHSEEAAVVSLQHSSFWIDHRLKFLQSWKHSRRPDLGQRDSQESASYAPSKVCPSVPSFSCIPDRIRIGLGLPLQCNKAPLEPKPWDQLGLLKASRRRY